MSALTEAITRGFPGFPPYGGAFEEVIPHLTIGHDQPHQALVAAERDVLARLPFEVLVDRVELWAGPPVTGPIRREWRPVRSYPLGRERP